MACRAGPSRSVGTMKEAANCGGLTYRQIYIVGNQTFIATIPSRVRLLGAALQQCLYEAFPPQTWAALHNSAALFLCSAAEWTRRCRSAAYFSELLIAVYLVLSLVPIPFTTEMIASAMPAAISPYSIAVAPDSSARKLRIVFIWSASNAYL